MSVDFDWVTKYREKSALWFHDGNPRRPHALLTSGKHSGGFFNSRLIISDDHLLRRAALDLLRLYIKQGCDISKVGCVVGPQTGATRLAQLICDWICLQNRSVSNGRTCVTASPAKNEIDGVKSMIFVPDDLEKMPGKAVLLCEDVLTTGTSVELAAQAVHAGGGTVMPYVLVLVNRTGLIHVKGKRVIALIDRAMPMWSSEKCPLCKAGSEALRPKDNWARLNAEY